jgi:hypothetical protein
MKFRKNPFRSYRVVCGQTGMTKLIGAFFYNFIAKARKNLLVHSPITSFIG